MLIKNHDYRYLAFRISFQVGNLLESAGWDYVYRVGKTVKAWHYLRSVVQYWSASSQASITIWVSVLVLLLNNIKPWMNESELVNSSMILSWKLLKQNCPWPTQREVIEIKKPTYLGYLSTVMQVSISLCPCPQVSFAYLRRTPAEGLVPGHGRTDWGQSWQCLCIASCAAARSGSFPEAPLCS